MSFAYKTLKGSDTTQAPYVANKQYTFPSNSLSSSGIIVYTGEYDPQYIISGTVYNAFDPQEDTIDNGYYRRFIFDSIQRLYYQNYISGSQSGSLFVSSAYDNYDQTTIASGAFNGAVEKFLSTYTGSIDQPKIRVISIPQDIYGNGLKPGTFIISSSTYYIRDDGQGNLYDYHTSGSIYNKDPYQGAWYAGTEDTKIYVGNIVYSPGFAIITNPDYLCFYPSNPIAKNDYYTFNNVSASKVLPILDNDFDDCNLIDDNTVMTYPLDGYSFPSFSVIGGEIHIDPCGANNLQVVPGTYKILYTVNNDKGTVSNKATCSLTIYNNKFTSSQITHTLGCWGISASQSVTFSLNDGIPPYSWSLNNSTWTGFSGCSNLYQPIVSLSVPTSDNVNVYLKDSTATIMSYSLDTQLYPITPILVSQSTCLNQNTGWISASSMGGNPTNNVSASIDNITFYPTPHVFNNLGTGSSPYTVYFKDHANCTTSSTAAITNPIPISITLQSVEADCPSDSGGPTGGISVGVSGGTGIYNYRWWNGSSFVKFVEDPTGLPAGTYNLFVSDSTGCNNATSSNIVVNSLTAIGFSGYTVTSPLCYGGGNGSITGGTLSGGSGSLIPIWNGPSGFVSNSVDIINLPAGNYYLTASDTVTGCYHIFGPYTITAPAEFKSSSFTYVGAGGTRTFRAGFTGGTTPWTASLYLSSSTLGLIFVTSSSGSGPGTIPMVPDVCFTEDTYWVLDGYDANGCHMTNYYGGAQLYVPTQVTPQNQVCYATTSLAGLCNCEDEGGTMNYTTFYISASNTTDPNALTTGYDDLMATHSIVYTDCKLLNPVPYGAYWNGSDGTVGFSGSVATPGNGEITGDDLGCFAPPTTKVNVYIQNGLAKTFSETSFNTTFESVNPSSHYINLPSFNMVSSTNYTIAQAGYLDFTIMAANQALSPSGVINVTIQIASGSSGYSTIYQDCVPNTSATFQYYGIFITPTYDYYINVVYTSGYGPNCP